MKLPSEPFSTVYQNSSNIINVGHILTCH